MGENHGGPGVMIVAMGTVTRREWLATRARARAMALAVLGAAGAAAADWGYRSLIASQGSITNLPSGYWSRVDFVTLFIAGIAATALSGVVLLGLRRDTAASFPLIAAFTGAAALGFLAIFSIGLALIVVATLLAMPAARSARTRNWREL